MVELVDTLVSGTRALAGVRVQVSSWAKLGCILSVEFFLCHKSIFGRHFYKRAPLKIAIFRNAKK